MFEESIPIVLDKERHLKLTLLGMKKFKDVTGIDLLKGGKDLKDMSEDDVTAFIWACLLPEDRKLTLEDVGYMLTPDNLNNISEVMLKVWGQAIPENEGEPDPNP